MVAMLHMTDHDDVITLGIAATIPTLEPSGTWLVQHQRTSRRTPHAYAGVTLECAATRKSLSQLQLIG